VIVQSRAGECGIDTERVAVESGSIADAVGAGVPLLTEGVELIGEYQGSGFQEPRYILRRADGQVIQLPRLLYVEPSHTFP
jgi:putative peptide zinc metalloprotease protein